MPIRRFDPPGGAGQPRRHKPKDEYHIGLDIGKRQDYTALAVVRKVSPPHAPQNFVETISEGVKRIVHNRPLDKPWFYLIYLERLELGTDHRDQMREIARQYHNLPTDLDDARLSPVAIDITGIGEGMTPMLDDLGVPHKDVWITSSTGEDRVGKEYHLGRSYLINHAKRALEQRTLIIPKSMKKRGSSLGATFEREARGMEYAITPANNLRYIHREGEHDDLVLAVSLACWSADKPPAMRVVSSKSMGF